MRRSAPPVVPVVHGSYRQVIDLLRDLLDLSPSMGTIYTQVARLKAPRTRRLPHTGWLV